MLRALLPVPQRIRAVIGTQHGARPAVCPCSPGSRLDMPGSVCRSSLPVSPSFLLQDLARVVMGHPGIPGPPIVLARYVDRAALYQLPAFHQPKWATADIEHRRLVAGHPAVHVSFPPLDRRSAQRAQHPRLPPPMGQPRSLPGRLHSPLHVPPGTQASGGSMA